MEGRELFTAVAAVGDSSDGEDAQQRVPSSSSSSNTPHHLSDDSFFPPPGAVPPDGPKHAHYAAVRPLGGGSFGEVTAGRHVASGAAVALKRVLVRRPDKGLPDNVLRELQTLRHLRGAAHVVRLLDHFALGASITLVFEFCPGGDLHGVLGVGAAGGGGGGVTREPLPPACVKGIISQVLLGVAACHARGVLHRDVKPGNILLAADGTLKLADFGLARFARRRRRGGPSDVNDTAQDEQGGDNRDDMGEDAREGGAYAATELVPPDARRDAEYTHTVQTRWRGRRGIEPTQKCEPPESAEHPSASRDENETRLEMGFRSNPVGTAPALPHGIAPPRFCTALGGTAMGSTCGLWAPSWASCSAPRVNQKP